MAKYYILTSLACAALGLGAQAFAADKRSGEIVIDAVVASIDGKPITLQDLSRKLSRQRSLTIKEASVDPEVKSVLDNMILDQLIEQEAQHRKLSVTEADIDGYINEVARRNNMGRADLEKALVKQGKSLEGYKTDIKSEILKSRLANQIFQGGVGISSDDVEAYLKHHSELGHGGSKIKLSQIFISTDKRSQEEGQKIVESVLAKLKDGEDFGDLAKKLSDSPDAAESGSLGTVVQEELNSSIFDAIASLKAGQVSEVVSGPDGFRIFRVDERLDQNEADLEQARTEARKALQQEKLQTKMQDYFTVELYKLHSVDKKI